jgi:hypothetical protein
MIGLTFDRYASLTAALPPHWRAALHAHIPEPVQAQAWRELREQTEREREDSTTAEVIALRVVVYRRGWDRRAA